MLGFDDIALNVGKRCLPHELLPLDLRGFLDLVGLAPFFRNFAVGLRLHQFGRRINVADQRVDRLDVVGFQGDADVSGGFGLAPGAAISAPRMSSASAGFDR